MWGKCCVFSLVWQVKTEKPSLVPGLSMTAEKAGEMRKGHHLPCTGFKYFSGGYHCALRSHRTMLTSEIQPDEVQALVLSAVWRWRQPRSLQRMSCVRPRVTESCEHSKNIWLNRNERWSVLLRPAFPFHLKCFTWVRGWEMPEVKTLGVVPPKPLDTDVSCSQEKNPH